MSVDFVHKQPQEPLTALLKRLLVNHISKLNLVTREEFETQTQVLLKTRLKVEQLEKRLLELNVE